MFKGENRFSVGDVVKLKEEYKEGKIPDDGGWAYWYSEMLKGKSAVITKLDPVGGYCDVAVDYDKGYIGFHELELAEEKEEVSANLVEFEPQWIDYDGRLGKPEHLHDNDKVEWVNSLGMSNTHSAGYLEWNGCGSQPVVKYKVVEYYQPEEQQTDAIPPEYVALGEELVPVEFEVEYTGSSVSYYSAEILHPTTKENPPYVAECNDIIEALEMNFAEGNIFKAMWRKAAARKYGAKKKGYDNGLYDAEKSEFFSHRLVVMEKQNASSN